MLTDPLLHLTLTALIALISGGALVSLRDRSRLTALQEQLQQQTRAQERLLAEQATALALSQQAAESARTRAAELERQQLQAGTEQQRLQRLNAALSTRLEEKEQQLARLETRATQLEQALADKSTEFNQLAQKTSELDARQAEKADALERQLAQFDAQKAALKTEFEQLATRIFEARGQQLGEHNRTQLGHLLDPLRDQLQQFHREVRDIHHKETQQQSILTTELRQLKALNQQITAEAHELATALKGQKKMQGNWGELILENVLDRAGLINGRDYQREVSINNREGARQRPDAIVYLPEHKHLIIDAKVSLNAYTRYINSDNELERQSALKAHIAAFSERIRELAERDYFELPGLNSPELVFMFVPIESAFVAAVQADESLFQQALAQNVLVATPTTLLTSLNIVRQLWRFEDQNRHSAELADRASKLYAKLRGLVGSMEQLGRQLDTAQQSYQKALGQLYSGRGNLIKQADEFRQLGVAVKQELPPELVERARLELEQPE